MGLNAVGGVRPMASLGVACGAKTVEAGVVIARGAISSARSRRTMSPRGKLHHGKRTPLRPKRHGIFRDPTARGAYRYQPFRIVNLLLDFQFFIFWFLQTCMLLGHAVVPYVPNICPVLLIYLDTVRISGYFPKFESIWKNRKIQTYSENPVVNLLYETII